MGPKENKDINLNDPVKIDAGYISGTVIGEPGNEVYVYRGIPYAKPPLKDLRWKPPQPVTPWSGIRECTVFPVWPAQGQGPWPPQPMSEEAALYLNVLTPAKNTHERLPVMIWFHGGGYFGLSGTQPTYNFPYLPQQGAVVVTVSTRLGGLGLLAHPLLSEESNGLSGNYLFLDLIASLKWVQRNIAAFGGDPNNVTIFGQSGGGWKVTAMMVSPLASGLFHRAIIQSGVGFMDTPLKDLEARGEQLFAKLGIDKEKEPLAAARALSWERIVEAEAAMAKEMDVMQVWDAAVDGWFLPDTAMNIFKAGKHNVVPLMVGATLGELPVLGKMMNMIPYSVDLFSANSQAGGKGYAYIFDHLPSKWKQEGCFSEHTTDVLYVFGCWNVRSEWDWFYEWSYVPAGAKQPDPGITEIDREVSQATMAMWVQFAKAGDPSVEGLITWPEYKSDTDQYLYIAEPLEVKSGFSQVGPQG